jgi:peroxiredoxin
MPDASATLKVGDHAPQFNLPAANRPESFRLADLLRGGPVIAEFLRGTW